MRIAQCADNGWEQILEGHGQDREMLHKEEDIHAVVLQAEQKTLPKGGGVGVILLLRIHLEPPSSKCLFLLIQPFCGGGEIGYDENARKCKEDGDAPVDDEQPKGEKENPVSDRLQMT